MLSIEAQMHELKEFAAKEKLEIVIGAALPPCRIFAGGFFRKNAFGLIQEYCIRVSICWFVVIGL